MGSLVSDDDALRRAQQTMRRFQHEVRTPLGQIIGYSELLEEELEDRGQQDLAPDLQRIRNAAMRLLDLVDGKLQSEQSAGAPARPPRAGRRRGAGSRSRERRRRPRRGAVGGVGRDRIPLHRGGRAPRSLKPKLGFEVRLDTCFSQVIRHCATVPRPCFGPRVPFTTRLLFNVFYVPQHKRIELPHTPG